MAWTCFRNHSCPQCRSKVTEKTLHPVYFNVMETPNEDMGTLLNKLNNLQAKLTAKDYDFKHINERCIKKEEEIVKLRYVNSNASDGS